MSDPVRTAGEVLHWLRTVQTQADLSSAERCVAVALALRLNGQTSQLNPTQVTLGSDAGTSDQTARRAIAKLRKAGLLAVEQSLGRISNAYVLTLPNPITSERVKPPNPVTSDRVKPAQPYHQRAPTLSPASANPITGDSQNRQRTEQRTEKSAPAPGGTRLSPSFLLPQEWADWTRVEHPDLDPPKVFAKFRDHYLAKPGKDGLSADWLATWRNWCRRERPAGPASNSTRPAGPEPTPGYHREFGPEAFR